MSWRGWALNQTVTHSTSHLYVLSSYDVPGPGRELQVRHGREGHSLFSRGLAFLQVEANNKTNASVK